MLLLLILLDSFNFTLLRIKQGSKLATLPRPDNILEVFVINC